MSQINNGKDLILVIKLSEFRYIVLFNKFINRNANKRSYYSLMP